MKQFIYDGGYRYNRFYLSNLLTGELIECSERDFDAIVVRFRNLYEMKYDGVNRQIFILDGQVVAAREMYYPELEKRTKK